MRYIITILLVFISASVFAQADAARIKKATADLNKALLKRDTVALKKLVSDKIQYGHSNGWIQTRRDMIDDMYNGKLTYTDIQQSDVQVQMDGSIACVRSKMTLSVAMNSKPTDFNLSVLQVWIKKKTGWILFARQSVKM